MCQTGLQAKRRKQHYHSYKGEAGRIAPNVLQRNFKAQKPNQKWTTDITQVNIHDHKLYLPPILDMYNGEIVFQQAKYAAGYIYAGQGVPKSQRHKRNDNALGSRMALSTEDISAGP
jgi:hypothetical protein